MSTLTCAIGITTHNRLPELRRTLGIIAALVPQPEELLICADGCNDGTAQFVRNQYPHANLIEHPESQGSIRSRIELMQTATSDILISLDDDSYPTDSRFVAQVRELFTAQPHVAVASFPQRTDEYPETFPILAPADTLATTPTPPQPFAAASIFRLRGGCRNSSTHMRSLITHCSVFQDVTLFFTKQTSQSATTLPTSCGTKSAPITGTPAMNNGPHGGVAPSHPF